MSEFFTTRQVAEMVGSPTWKVRRLFEDGTLPEPPRFAGKRAISSCRLLAIFDAMRRRGWIEPEIAACQ